MVGTYKSLSYWHIHCIRNIKIRDIEVQPYVRWKTNRKVLLSCTHSLQIMYRQESWIFQRMHLGNDRLTSSRRNSWKEDIFGYLLSWVYRTVLVLLPSLLRELSIFLLLLRGTVGFWKVHCVYQENVHWQFLLIYSVIDKILF